MWLFPVDRECEQDVAGHRGSGIPGSDVEHSSRDDWTHTVDGASPRLDSIDGSEILNRIKIPDDAAGPGVVTSKVSVPGSEERDARDHRHGSRLSGAAACNTKASGLWRRRCPELFAGRHS